MIPINPWIWHILNDEMPELPELSDRTVKILKIVAIVGILVAIGLFIWLEIDMHNYGKNLQEMYKK